MSGAIANTLSVDYAFIFWRDRPIMFPLVSCIKAMPLPLGDLLSCEQNIERIEFSMLV